MSNKSTQEMRKQFTKAQVDYLIAEDKYVKDIPPITTDGNYKVIVAIVCRKGDKNPGKSLVVNARVSIPVPGIPAQLPGVALYWNGHRIRGIDREPWHDNPDGSKVLGWHEHLWSPEYEDSLVRSISEPKHKDMQGILKEALKRWNIKILKEQMDLE